jgi:light-harvesting complex I chlorophyll a/b binding protein 1
LTPGAAPRTPASASDAVGVSVRGAQQGSSGQGAYVFPSLVGATAALMTARSATGRHTALSAVATADAEIPPPPPPFNPAGEIGAIMPLGFFDPLGFSKVGDEQGFRQLRAAEIKHGRVAMMASIGALGQHFIRFPGFEKAHGTFGAAVTGEGVLGFVVLFAASGVLELAWKDEKSREPGNFGDPFGVNMYNEEMRNKEINNGRMAMISVLGIFAAELATGKDAIEQFGLSAIQPVKAAVACQRANSVFVGSTQARVSVRSGRPLSAVATADAEVPPPPPPFNPAEEIGAIMPLGFFDPLGFSKVGDEQGFRQLRAAEIKHGRVAMMASIGALGQHFIRFPGFEKAHGTFGAALTGEGVLGFVVLFAASGVLELAWKDDKNMEPGNFGDPFGVNMYNEEMRNKEINNGRMAMISVLGIFAAELATGKDAIEQFGL